MEKVLLNRREVANHFGVVDKTIRNWEVEGIIKPVCYIKNRPRYSIEDVLAIGTNVKKPANQ